jgi:short-chain fatty acids transporter
MLPAHLSVPALGAGWLAHEIAGKGLAAITSLNTCNFLFLMGGLLLNWRPRVEVQHPTLLLS